MKLSRDEALLVRHDKNMRELHYALERAGGAAETILAEEQVAKFLRKLAINEIDIVANYAGVQNADVGKDRP